MREKDGSEQIMRIQEAAETLGLTTETLRYYERVGLIGSVARSEGGPEELHRRGIGGDQQNYRAKARGDFRGRPH